MQRAHTGAKPRSTPWHDQRAFGQTTPRPPRAKHSTASWARSHTSARGPATQAATAQWSRRLCEPHALSGTDNEPLSAAHCNWLPPSRVPRTLDGPSSRGKHYYAQLLQADKRPWLALASDFGYASPSPRGSSCRIPHRLQHGRLQRAQATQSWPSSNSLRARSGEPCSPRTPASGLPGCTDRCHPRHMPRGPQSSWMRPCTRHRPLGCVNASRTSHRPHTGPCSDWTPMLCNWSNKRRPWPLPR